MNESNDHSALRKAAVCALLKVLDEIAENGFSSDNEEVTAGYLALEILRLVGF